MTRITLNTDGAAYEVTRDGDFIAVRLYDVTGDDALIHFEPAQLATFCSHLAAARPTAALFAEAFLRLSEMHGAEAERIWWTIASHVRSAKPLALLEAEARHG